MTDDKSKVARLHYRKYSVFFPLKKYDCSPNDFIIAMLHACTL